jgi:polar amino acid transport system ATP-binding protein
MRQRPPSCARSRPDAFESGTIDVARRVWKAARRPIDDAARLRRSVGLVFQFHCLFEHLSALQNVCLAPVHVYGTPHRAAEETGRDLLQQLGVEARGGALPRELSGGEAQRVAIARALAVNPRCC